MGSNPIHRPGRRAAVALVALGALTLAGCSSNDDVESLGASSLDPNAAVVSEQSNTLDPEALAFADDTQTSDSVPNDQDVDGKTRSTPSCRSGPTTCTPGSRTSPSTFVHRTARYARGSVYRNSGFGYVGLMRCVAFATKLASLRFRFSIRSRSDSSIEVVGTSRLLS